MTPFTLRRTCLCAAFAAAAVPAGAQLSPSSPRWREETAGVGATARVLIIGAHPDDEDNALIAWLSLGRHVETAYLSLTRGENGVNVSGRERAALLGMVRTAELLAERKRDGAHQYFTRAYDFGHAKNDSVAYAGWPHDSLLSDVVSVMRAFRPHVVISLFAGDSTDRDGQHQVAGAIAREAFMLAGDTVRYPAKRASRLGAWTVGAFYRLVDDTTPAGAVRINVGELDRERGRSYAEIGAEIRGLQHTQPRVPAPHVGAVYRLLRRDSVHAGGGALPFPSLFATDTGWTRFAALSIADSVRSAIDTAAAATRALASDAPQNSLDSATSRLARIVRSTTRARAALPCAGQAAPRCPGLLGDLAVSLATTQERATRALLDATGVVVDVTGEREAVAVGDSVGVTAAVYNGGDAPVSVARVEVDGARSIGFSASDSAMVAPDSVGRWSGYLRMAAVSYPWWFPGGVIPGTWIYNLGMPGGNAAASLITGDDRVLSTSATVMLRVAGTDVTTRVGPLVARNETTLRGDDRRPLAGVPRLSLVLERGKEYAAAAVPFERLYRVRVESSVSHIDTVSVTMDLRRGLTTDSSTQSVVLPPFGGRTLFFRVRGRWPTGEFPIDVSVAERAERGMTIRRAGLRVIGDQAARVNPDVITTNTGFLSFEYPHIPTQRYPRNATDSVQAVDLRVPAKLRVAIVRSPRDDELESRIVELGVAAYTIDPSALGITDLSFYTTMLIAPRAFAELESLLPNAAAVRRFAEHGGTVVVLYGRDELLAPDVLPYPIAFDPAKPVTVLDPETPVRMSSPRSALLDWPNRITPADFMDWAGTRARELPASFDAHYRRVLAMNDDDGRPTDAAILPARVGNGVFIYTALSLDQQLLAVNPGAARLLVNLLSAGVRKP